MGAEGSAQLPPGVFNDRRCARSHFEAVYKSCIEDDHGTSLCSSVGFENDRRRCRPSEADSALQTTDCGAGGRGISPTGLQLLATSRFLAVRTRFFAVCKSSDLDGRPTRARTWDQRIKSPLLYQLSYGPTRGNAGLAGSACLRGGESKPPPIPRSMPE